MQNIKFVLFLRSLLMSVSSPFHLAFAVTEIEAKLAFYTEKLGCKVGRSAERWIDFDFFGHQVSAHLGDSALSPTKTNPVDGEKVPSLHFGAILDWDDWHAMKGRLEANDTDFIISPTTRFAGEAGEQATMFFCDTSGNALEFKTFRDKSMIFVH
jgi:extradiol dioxygenase family protein